MSKKLNRTKSREFAFQFLYHLNLLNFNEQIEKFKNDEKLLESSVNDFFETQEDNNNLEKTFATNLIAGVINNEDNLNQLIIPLIKKNDLSLLPKIDYTILKLSILQFLEFKDIPRKVVINEAVELGKKFGTKDSFSLINAILDKISKDL